METEKTIPLKGKLVKCTSETSPYNGKKYYFGTLYEAAPGDYDNPEKWQFTTDFDLTKQVGTVIEGIFALKKYWSTGKNKNTYCKISLKLVEMNG